MALDLKKLFPNTKFTTVEELKAKEDSFSIGDRVKVANNIRCIQNGQIGTIVQIEPEDEHGWKSFIVKFDDKKYGAMGFQSGNIDKIGKTEMKLSEDVNNEYRTTEEALRAVISEWETFLDAMEYDLDGHYPPNYVSRVNDMERAVKAAREFLKNSNRETIKEHTSDVRKIEVGVIPNGFYSDDEICTAVENALQDMECEVVSGPEFLTGGEITEGDDSTAVSGHKWEDFDSFDEVFSQYLPAFGEGDTMATQIVTAVSKLVYNWFNDGDLYDNTENGMEYFNDLSSYANWLIKYVPDTRIILDGIFDISSGSFDDEYADLLYSLCETATDILEDYTEKKKIGSIYDCEGPFKTVEEEEDEDDEEGAW